MADFAHWVEACAPALGWKRGVFTGECLNLRADLELGVLCNWSVFPVLWMMLKNKGVFEGTMAQLLSDLERQRRGAELSAWDRPRPADWPRTAQMLGIELRRFTPALRHVGVKVEKLKRSGRGIKVRLSLEQSGNTQATAG
jgi:hypothetical protein